MKRTILTVAGFLALALLPLAASAQIAGYDGGFFIKNDEDTFKLKINGAVQTKFFWERDPRRNDPNIPGTDPTTKSSYMSFMLRRAQVGFKASYHDAVTAGFTLKHAQVSGPKGPFNTVQVTGATASVEIIPEFVVTVGQVGLPLDHITETSSKWFLLPELPLTATQDEDASSQLPVRPSFSAPDGLGVNFSGGYWKWFYSLSVVNGNESNYTVNPNRWFSFGFRTGFNILDPVPGSLTDFECSETPKLTVSAGVNYQGKRDGNLAGHRIKYILTSSLGVGVRWGGLAFTTEGYFRRTRNETLGQGVYNRFKLTDVGYYAALGYYVLPKKLELAAQAAQIFRQGPANDSWEFGGGLNYYIFDNNLKLQLAYTLTASYDAEFSTAAPDPDQMLPRRKVHNVSLMASAFF